MSEAIKLGRTPSVPKVYLIEQIGFSCLSGSFSKPQAVVYRRAAPRVSETLREFQSMFATEEACQRYLAECRWPDGFVCPRSGNRSSFEIVKPQRWQCTRCRYQVSLTEGTIEHNTNTPLTVWFWAGYLMTTDKRGVSALLLQRQLGLRRYKTVWMMLHKLRQAMVDLAREPLRGEVDVDDTWMGVHKLVCGEADN